MASVSELSARFSALSPNAKAMFLSRVAHWATISARESHIATPDHPERSFENPDAAILRDANNFVHRVTGYTMHVLNKTEMGGQDESVMAMIVEEFKMLRLESYLEKWLSPSDRLFAHTAGVSFLIETTPDGVYLYTRHADGFLGDTWHQSVDEAKSQATHTANTPIEDWQSVSAEFQGSFVANE